MSNEHVDGCLMNSLMRNTDQCICPPAMQEMRERLAVAEREREIEHQRYIDAVVTANNRANDLRRAKAERDHLAEALRDLAEALAHGGWTSYADDVYAEELARRARAVLAECAGK